MSLASLLFATALVALAAPAVAQDDLEVCVADHKLVQTERETGRYLEARDAAARCAQSGCPGLIRQDCSAWYVDLADSTPSVVVRVRDAAGSDVPDAQITLGSRTALDEGRAVEVNPGTSLLRVRAAGFLPYSRRIVVRQGEKNRRVEVGLSPATKGGSQQEPGPRRVSPAVITLASVGLVGLGAFAGLAILGKVDQARLDDRGCKPNCARSDVDRVNRLYLSADAAGAVGGAAIITATVLHILQRRRERRADVAVSPFGLVVSGAF